MKHSDWIRDNVGDVHFRADGQTGGWTVKTWVASVDTFITTKHKDSLPPTMDQVVEAIQKKIQTLSTENEA